MARPVRGVDLLAAALRCLQCWFLGWALFLPDPLSTPYRTLHPVMALLCGVPHLCELSCLRGVGGRRSGSAPDHRRWIRIRMVLPARLLIRGLALGDESDVPGCGGSSPPVGSASLSLSIFSHSSSASVGREAPVHFAWPRLPSLRSSSRHSRIRGLSPSCRKS